MIDVELETSERVLSVLKNRLTELPRPNSSKTSNNPNSKHQVVSSDEEDEDEMTRTEMANYMAGMLE